MTAGDSGDIVIVGAGLGGIRTIEAIRRNGYTGTITLVGDEIHLPYDRPPLSKGVLAGYADPASVQLADRTDLSNLGVTWRPGATAIALDASEHRVHLDDGQTIGFTKLVIATGASPVEITSVNSVYLAREQLGYDVYDGAWTDAGTFESYLLANQMMAPLPTT